MSLETTNIIQLLFIFFPGIVATILLNFSITGENKLKLNDGIAYSFVLGILCYLPLSIFGDGQIFKNLLIQNPVILPIEIGKALLLAFIYSIVLTKIINSELLHTILRKYGISNKLGKKYLIQGLISSKDKNINLCNKWVSIRYQNKEQVYIGYIQALNVTDTEYIEILLKDVSTYFDNKEQPSYHLEATFICEKPENIILEFH